LITELYETILGILTFTFGFVVYRAVLFSKSQGENRPHTMSATHNIYISLRKLNAQLLHH